MAGSHSREIGSGFHESGARNFLSSSSNFYYPVESVTLSSCWIVRVNCLNGH